MLQLFGGPVGFHLRIAVQMKTCVISGVQEEKAVAVIHRQCVWHPQVHEEKLLYWNMAVRDFSILINLIKVSREENFFKK